jgi:hypothetical protein
MGSEWRMPGRSMNSRTTRPSTTCWLTTRSTLAESTRLYRAEAPRAPGTVANPLPKPACCVGSISRTSTFGPCVQRPKQLCQTSSARSRAAWASSADLNTSYRPAEPRRSPHSGPRQITILKRRPGMTERDGSHQVCQRGPHGGLSDQGVAGPCFARTGDRSVVLEAQSAVSASFNAAARLGFVRASFAM